MGSGPFQTGPPKKHFRQEEEAKERLLKQAQASITESISDAIVIKEQNLFLICRPDGMIPLHENHGLGLYLQDTRHLCGYRLCLDEYIPDLLVANSARGNVSVHQLANPEMRLKNGKVFDRQSLGIQLIRRIYGQTHKLLEVLNIDNYSSEKVEVELRFDFRIRVEDIFCVRGLWQEMPGHQEEPFWRENRLHSRYIGADAKTRTYTIEFFPPPSRTNGSSAVFSLQIAPRGRVQLMLIHLVGVSAKKNRLRIVRQKPAIQDVDEYLELAKNPEEGGHRATFLRGVTIESDNPVLNNVLYRCSKDLEMLESAVGTHSYFAAGLPWFNTLFGRDSLITALELLPFQPEVARDTLRLLSSFQGKKNDSWRDENPGKILHEIRFGELAALGHIPHSPYYGTADATPLFLILLGRYIRWTGDFELWDELKESIDLASAWIDRYGDSNGDGYQDYSSSTKNGLINQGWKDSGNAIVTQDGGIAEPPISLVELQGLAYAAKLELADIRERTGDSDGATQLRAHCLAFRHRFNRDFWLEEEGVFALALDRTGNPLRVVSSNAGHALWCGIADTAKARRTAGRLLERDMFSGWGVRTLSANAAAFNPVGYHIGTVWPHDNALLVGGFRRYGFDQAAKTVFQALLSASSHFHDYHLPELFAGYSKEDYGVPVSYPVACHPQAWSSGALPYMLVELLGLQADGARRRLRIIRPQLPEHCRHLLLRNLRIGEATLDLEFSRVSDTIAVRILRQQGRLSVSLELGASLIDPPEQRSFPMQPR